MRKFNKNIAAFLPLLLILAGCSHTIPASIGQADTATAI